MRAFLSLVPLALAVVLAGCGGDAERGAGSGADVVPVSTSVFVALETTIEGDQWQAAQMLARRLPAARRPLALARRELEQHGIDFDRDVTPALGPEVDLAVLGRGRGEETWLLLTQPRDERKLAQLLARAKGELVSTQADGWTVIAESREDLRRFERERGDGSLGGSDEFEAATDDLPDDALVTGYVSGRATMESLASALPRRQGATDALAALLPGRAFPSLGFTVRGEEGGVRLDAGYPLEGEDAPEAFEPALPSELPAGAAVFLSFADLRDYVRGALRREGDANEEFDRSVAEAELALGVSLEEDVLPLLEGEGALVAYPDRTPRPRSRPASLTISLVLAVDDEERALATIDRIARRAAALVRGVALAKTEVGGVEATRVSFRGCELYYAVVRGKLVVTTRRAGIALVGAEGTKLSEDESYRDARQAAGAPREAAAFAYAEPHALAAAHDAPRRFREDLEPLGSLFAFASSEDDRLHIEGFLPID